MASRQSGLFLGLSVNAFLRAMGWEPTAKFTKEESASTLFRFFRSCMSSEHFGQLAWQFERMSGSSGLKVQAAIAC